MISLYQWAFVLLGLVIYKLAGNARAVSWLHAVAFRVLTVIFVLALVVEGCEIGMDLMAHAFSFTAIDGDVIQRHLRLQQFDYVAD